jgi:hypothetical protein
MPKEAIKPGGADQLLLRAITSEIIGNASL